MEQYLIQVTYGAFTGRKGIATKKGPGDQWAVVFEPGEKPRTATSDQFKKLIRLDRLKPLLQASDSLASE